MEGPHVAEDVVKVIRNEILGFSTFLVREAEWPHEWQGRDVDGAVMLRGNARKDAPVVAATLQSGLDSRCAPHLFHSRFVMSQERPTHQEIRVPAHTARLNYVCQPCASFSTAPQPRSAVLYSSADSIPNNA